MSESSQGFESPILRHVILRRVEEVQRTTNILFAVGLTLLSGFSDALGFVHASRAWENDRFLLREARWSLILFTGGIVTYILVIRYLHPTE